jgi:maltose alpha-D-glucosyltransferase/alpha-amylase
LSLSAEPEIRYLSAEQSNSSVVIGGAMVLKMIRKVSGGVHPELEMGAFLTQAGHRNISPLLGSVIRVDGDGLPHLLMIAQGYLNNQGDAWEWTQNNLERAVRDDMTSTQAEQGQHFNALVELADFAGMLGRRLGEMHQVLAGSTQNVDFRASPSNKKDGQAWSKSIKAQVERALQLLEQHKGGLDDENRGLVDELLSQRKSLLSHIETLSKQAVGGLIMRVHGDLHLGQILVVQGDAYLIDFEGEPARPLEERRGKYSPFKDVSGVLRSFDYAAAMAVRNAQSVDASPEAAQARQRVAKRYLHDARHAFVEAYRLATADLAHAWEDPQGERAALELFSLEKAAYEIAYEAENRPSWLAVPLHGLFGLLSTRGEES